MGAYILRRIISSFFLLLLVSAITFFLLELAPGDPAVMLLGQDATEEGIKQLRQELGLDKPAITRYFLFLSSLFQGDLGRFKKDFEVLGSHLGNAKSKFDDADKRLDKFADKLEIVSETSVEKLPEPKEKD